jgi:hypothetical protein
VAEIEAALEEAINRQKNCCTSGIVMDSSSWVISAINPAEESDMKHQYAAQLGLGQAGPEPGLWQHPRNDWQHASGQDRSFRSTT